MGYNISRLPTPYNAVYHRKSRFGGPHLEDVHAQVWQDGVSDVLAACRPAQSRVRQARALAACRKLVAWDRQLVAIDFPNARAAGMKAALLRRVILPTWQYVRRQNGFQRLRDLEQTQWLSAGELQDLQWRRIGDLLEHAYAHVPYYSEAHASSRREPIVLSSASARWRELPLLDRATINRPERHRCAPTTSLPERFVPNGTGGSTGEPLRFFDDRDGFGVGNCRRLASAALARDRYRRADAPTYGAPTST